MKFTRRTVKSRPGMTQEQALESLQDHPMFKPGTKIAAIRKRGKVWVADLLEPKVAAPFPPESDDAESDDPIAAEADEDKDPVDEPESDEKEEKHGEENPDEEMDEIDDLTDGAESKEDKMLMLLEQILDAVAPHPDMEEKHHGPDDELGLDAGPDGPPPAPPAPKGPGNAKLKPGETRNMPGATPIGAPAFASVGKAATFVASRPATVTVKQAKAELDAEYGPMGYEVKRIKREGDVLKALVSKR